MESRVKVLHTSLNNLETTFQSRASCDDQLLCCYAMGLSAGTLS